MCVPMERGRSQVGWLSRVVWRGGIRNKVSVTYIHSRQCGQVQRCDVTATESSLTSSTKKFKVQGKGKDDQ